MDQIPLKQCMSLNVTEKDRRQARLDWEISVYCSKLLGTLTERGGTKPSEKEQQVQPQLQHWNSTNDNKGKA